MPRPKGTARHARLRELLSEARQRAGMTQVELSRRINRPQTFIAKYELGRHGLDIVELLDICHALGASPQRVVRELLRTPNDRSEQ